jgi:hypothetical protein
MTHDSDGEREIALPLQITGEATQLPPAGGFGSDSPIRGQPLRPAAARRASASMIPPIDHSPLVTAS